MFQSKKQNRLKRLILQHSQFVLYQLLEQTLQIFSDLKKIGLDKSHRKTARSLGFLSLGKEKHELIQGKDLIHHYFHTPTTQLNAQYK